MLFVITAPSGAGKTTLWKRTITQVPNLKFSISHTTRKPRQGEVDGKDYYFVSDEVFDELIKKGAFVEWAWVYGNRYGTSWAEIERAKKDSVDLIIEIDQQGAKQLKKALPEAILIFILPPSLASLRERLNLRGTDTEEEITRRLKIASDEISEYYAFDYIIINDDLEDAVRKLTSIITAERSKVKVMEPSIRKLLGGKGMVND